MAIPYITTLPPAPSRNDPPDVFSNKADLFVAALPPFGVEINTAADWMNDTFDLTEAERIAAGVSAANALQSENAASGHASTATTKAGEADASAIAAGVSEGNASDSAILSASWAEGVGEVVPGQYSAKYWATEAESVIISTIIDDASTGLDRAWSASKITSELSGYASATYTIMRDPNALTSLNDLNDAGLVANGLYYKWGSNLPTNAPDSYGVMLSIDDTNQNWQMALAGSTAHIYLRRRNSGTWGGWAKMISDQDAEVSNWNTAYGWGNHAGLYAAANHDHTRLNARGAYSWDMSLTPHTVDGQSLFSGFCRAADGAPHTYSYVLQGGGHTNGGGGFQLAFPYTSSYGGIKVRTYNYGGSWNAWETLINTGWNNMSIEGGAGTMTVRTLDNNASHIFQCKSSGGAVRFEVQHGAGALVGATAGWTVESSFTATGNVTAGSDIRIKTNIELIPDALEKTMRLNGYTFDRIDSPEIGRQAGVIAQEVMEVLPEVVCGGPTEDDPDAIYSVAYGNITALLIEAIKEQQGQISDQQRQIDELKELVHGLAK